MRDRSSGGKVGTGPPPVRAARFAVGGGYGGDSDWLHGMWNGEKFTERLTYDMTDPAIVGRAGFGVIDHVGRTARLGATTRRASPTG